MLTLEQLQKLISSPREDETLEFKEARSQFDYSKLMKYCVALANEGGGHLILGVTDKNPRAIVGTEAFRDLREARQRIHDTLRIRVETAEVYLDDKRVVAFVIPSRPVGHPMEYEGAYLMRVGEALKPMTPDQLRKILGEGRPGFLEHDASDPLDSDHIVKLLDIQVFFDLLKLPFPASRDGVLQRLESERLIRHVGDGMHRITNLGALLLAKDMREFDTLMRRTIRVVKYKGKNKLQTERDIIGQKGYASGFENLITYVNSQLPMNEVIGQALRDEVRMFPELAIRELVANALVHQDFEESGSVTIEIYSDRIEITNPGKPLIPTNRFVDEYKARNDRLADLMRRMGICEEKGSGIDKVVHSTEFYQLPPPSFRATPFHTTMTLYAHQDFADMEPADRVWACYLHACLRYVSNEKMTNQSLRERFRLDDSKAKSASVSQIIAQAVAQQWIKLDDPENTSKRYARYVPFWA
ncbi:ATP-dependent DNA helicase RecG [Bordetella tumbae]|uniref:ATP-binding protein n=1 Tax=Bordetella tumbae TaxID=1649139 RepID=UPI0039EE6893